MDRANPSPGLSGCGGIGRRASFRYWHLIHTHAAKGPLFYWHHKEVTHLVLTRETKTVISTRNREINA